jgi:hypothetical protein
LDECSDWLWLLQLFLRFVCSLVLEMLEVEFISVSRSNFTLWSDKVSFVLLELRHVAVKLDLLWVSRINLVQIIELVLLVQKFWILPHFPRRA